MYETLKHHFRFFRLFLLPVLFSMWFYGFSCIGIKDSSADSGNTAAIIIREGKIVRHFSHQLLGLNGNLTKGPSWDDTLFANAVRELHPAIIRYPGGTVGNYWDWNEGWFVQSGQKLPKGFDGFSKVKYGISELKKAVAITGAEVVFEINMMTSDLDQQINMLHAAANSGIDIRFVELGNEFYSEEPDHLKFFPTAADYAAKATTWKKKIQKEFPQAEIAFVGAAYRGSAIKKEKIRMTTWNDEFVKTVSTPGVLTYHIYVGGGNSDVLADSVTFNRKESIQSLSQENKSANAPAITDEIENIFRNLKGELNGNFISIQKLPANTKIWVTEFNLFDRAQRISGTWLHALIAGYLAMRLLENPAVEMMLFHNITSDAKFAAIFRDENAFADITNPVMSTPYYLSAPGAAMQLFFRAFEGATEATNLEFENAGNDPLIFGWEIESTNQKRFIVLNTGQSNFASAIPDFAKGIINRYYSISANPIRTISGINPSEMKSGFKKIVDETINFPGYSLTILE